MGALAPLWPVLLALLAGHGSASIAALGAITLQQWAQIGAVAIKEAPDVIKAFNALPVPQMGTPGPVLVNDLERALVTGVVTANLRRWIIDNEAAAIARQRGAASESGVP